MVLTCAHTNFLVAPPNIELSSTVNVVTSAPGSSARILAFPTTDHSPCESFPGELPVTVTAFLPHKVASVISAVAIVAVVFGVG